MAKGCRGPWALQACSTRQRTDHNGQQSSGFSNDQSCTVTELSSGHSFAVNALHARLCWSFERC